MKIVFLNQFISGGGAERFTCLIASEMAKIGHDVILMTDLFYPFAYEFDSRVRRVALFLNQKEAKSHLNFIYMVRNARAMIMKERPDVIIGVLPVMNMAAIIAAIGTNTRVIATHHTSFDRKVGLHIQFIQYYGYRFADAVSILTEADSQFLGKRLSKKVVMPNPLAYPCVSDNNQERRKNILAVGRLDVWKLKGFDLLIKAWSQIANQFPDWKLEIAGTGENDAIGEVTSMIEDLHVSKQVVLLGFRKDIDAIMRNSSIFALTSRVEGFGMVLIEAMSQGCACVSFDDGGRQREIITPGIDGIIVDGNDVKKLSDSIKILIQDKELRSKLSTNAIKRADDFSLDKITTRWMDLINRVVNNQIVNTVGSK